MKKLLMIITALAVCSTAAFAESGKEAPGQRDGGNWGQATSGAISGGWDQGGHASDPSGDGKGKGDTDQPRSGLANVGDRGDLSGTMDALGL